MFNVVRNSHQINGNVQHSFCYLIFHRYWVLLKSLYNLLHTKTNSLERFRSVPFFDTVFAENDCIEQEKNSGKIKNSTDHTEATACNEPQQQQHSDVKVHSRLIEYPSATRFSVAAKRYDRCGHVLSEACAISGFALRCSNMFLDFRRRRFTL